MVDKINTRPETGAMEFEDDWTGVFIRGDNAMYYAMSLEEIQSDSELNKRDDLALAMAALKSLLDLLKNSNQFFDNPNKQLMKKFNDCGK